MPWPEWTPDDYLDQKSRIWAYCLTVTTEIREHADCLKSGVAESTYGDKPSIFSGDGIVDRVLIGSWVKLALEDEDLIVY